MKPIAAPYPVPEKNMTPDSKYIYAVDFDKTLSFANWPEVGEPNEDLIKYLIRMRMEGNKVILYTSRNGEPLKDAVRFCRAYGLEFDAVNENLPEMIEAYHDDSRKISADFYIDDRGIKPNEINWAYANLHKRSLNKEFELI